MATPLANIDLLADLPEDELRNLERLCKWRRFARHEKVLDKEADNRDVFFLVSGRVQIVNYSTSGRKVALATLTAGTFFGELSAIDGERRSANAVALEDSRLAALAPEHFLALMRRYPELAIRVLRRLAMIVRLNDERIMDLTTVGVMARVYRELIRLAEPDPVAPGRWLIHPARTHEAIAGSIGTTRETVSRVMSQLSQDGVIRRKGRTIYIEDLERLGALAGQSTGIR